MNPKNKKAPSLAVRVGQVATSIAGRDSGKPYIVVRVLDERFVLLADGDTRRIKNPKKKNVRHLIFHDYVIDEVAAGNRRISDKIIREGLSGITDDLLSKEEVKKDDHSEGVDESGAASSFKGEGKATEGEEG